MTRKRAPDTPARRRMRAKRREKRMSGLPRSWTAADVVHALTYWGSRCCYCGDDITNGHNMDHYIPVASRSRKLANPGTTPQNLVPSCRTCNTAKSSRHPHLWLTGRFGRKRATEIEQAIAAYFATCRVPVFEVIDG